MTHPANKVDPYHYRLFSDRLHCYHGDSQLTGPGADAQLLDLEHEDLSRLISLLSLDYKGYKIRDIDSLRHIQSRHDQDLFGDKKFFKPGEGSEVAQEKVVDSEAALNTEHLVPAPEEEKKGFAKLLSSLFGKAKAVEARATSLDSAANTLQKAPSVEVDPLPPQDLESVLAKKSLTGIIAYCLDRQGNELDWQSLADFYEEASSASRKKIDSLFERMAHMSLESLITPPSSGWFRPVQMADGPERREVLGRIWVRNEKQNLVREYRYVQQFFVYVGLVEESIFMVKDRVMTPTGMIETQRRNQRATEDLVGTSATLEGAIEIAVLANASFDHKPRKVGQSSQWAQSISIYEGELVTRDKQSTLSAKIVHPDEQGVDPEIDWDRVPGSELDMLLMNTLASLGQERALSGFLEDDLNL